MGEIHTIAGVTSIVMALVLIAACKDIWKRSPFPRLKHGSLELSSRTMKWVWSIGLLVAFSAGGPELLARSEMDGGAAVEYWNSATMGAAGYEQVEQIEQQSGWEVRVASYRYGVNEIRWRSGQQFRTERVAFHLPVWLPLALLGYVFVVVRGRERTLEEPLEAGRLVK